jgi:3-isopropylmalate dehydrogenase
MVLRYSSVVEDGAHRIEDARICVLASGLHIGDIMSPGMARVGTQVMGEAVQREIEKLD